MKFPTKASLRCLKFPTRVGVVITGEQIRDLREQRGLTQSELGQLVGVSMRTIGNWERGETIPRSREGRIRAALDLDDRGSGRSPRVADASDAELLAEVAKRMSRPIAKAANDPGQSMSPQVTASVIGSLVHGFAESRYGLAARAGDENIGQDQIEHEP